MNREIKFRAWDKRREKWVTDDIVIFPNGKITYPEGGWDINGEIVKPKELNIILVQYTGLKDRNGKEIYEGDIVKNYWTMNNEAVKYMGVTFMTENMYEESAVVNLEECEVIGNIYENPELCEEK